MTKEKNEQKLLTRDELLELYGEMRAADAEVGEAEKVFAEVKGRRNAVYAKCTHQFYTEELSWDGHRSDTYYECMVCRKELWSKPAGGLKVTRDEKYRTIFKDRPSMVQVIERLFDLKSEREKTKK